MTTAMLSPKKLKKIERINEVVKEYFTRHPQSESIGNTLLMPLYNRKGIFLNDTENGLPARVILRELYNTNQLHLLPDTIVIIDKRTYYFFRKLA